MLFYNKIFKLLNFWYEKLYNLYFNIKIFAIPKVWKLTQSLVILYLVL